MNVDEMFPSNYLKAADLKGQPRTAVIKGVSIEDVGDGDKPVMSFNGTEKMLVLNKTNATAISESYGKYTESWTGKPIQLYPDKTMFQGRRVDCIRVRVLDQPNPGPTTQPPEEPPSPDDSDCPF